MITLGSKNFERRARPSGVVQAGVNYAYGNDFDFTYERNISISSGNSTYFLEFHVINTSNTNLQRSVYWKIVRSGGVNTVYAGDDPTYNGNSLAPNQGGYQATNITIANIFAPPQPFTVGSQTFLEEDLSGTWEIYEVIYETGSTPPSPSVQWSFDYRWLVLREFRTLRKRVDPVSRNNRCQFRGDWRALPVSTSLYPGGWTPTSSVSWGVDIGDTAGNLLTTLTGSSTVSAPDPVQGKVAELVCDWDCKKASGKIKYGVFFGLASGLCSVPAVGMAYTGQADARALCTRCACKDGLLRMAISLASIGSQASNPMVAVMAFSGNFTEDGTASMGYGWKSNTGIRVYDDPVDSSLIYTDETGMSMRWALSGGNYVPYTEDNYSQIEKTTSNPNYTYAVTFEDQTRREFDAAGELLLDIDRNGNELTYDRSSGNLVISDGKGRSIYYDYGLTPRSDGQTQTVRVNDPVNGRLTTMSYYSSSHPVSPDRLESITDPAGETMTFEYDSDGQISVIYDARGIMMSQYLYDDLGRRIAEQSYDQVYTQYDFGDQVLIFPAPVDCVRTSMFDLNADPSDPAYLRQSYSFYDDFYNVVDQWELVDRTVLPNVINMTEIQYGDPLNPFLPTRQISPNGANTWMTYNAQGSLSTVTDDHLNVTTYEYAEDIDPMPINPKHQKLLRKIHRPEVLVNGVLTTDPPTEMQYDSNGNLVKVIDAQSNETELTRRSDGLVTDVTDRRGFTTTMGYDSSTANLVSITTPAGPGSAPARTTSLTYDPYDNVYEVSDPLLNTIRNVFDGNDRMVEAEDARGKLVYSNYVDGLLEWIEAPTNQGSGGNRRRTRFDYDFSGRVEIVNAQNGPNNATDYETRVAYGYTGFSQLKNLSRLKRTSPTITVVASTEVEYDPLGRAVRSADFLNRQTLAAYAPFCVGHTTLSPRGVETSSSFDTLCRLVQVETQEERHLYAYDELGRMVGARVGERYAHGPALNREGVDYSKSFYKHDTLYEYDSLDRVTLVTYANGETVSYQYDAVGNVTQMIDVHGHVTEYTYYHDGRLHTVDYEGQVFTYNYDAAGRLETIAYPSGGLVASFTTTTGATGWDANGQLLSLRYLKSGGHFHRFEYTYDDSGNRITLVDTPDSGAATSWAYGYDYLNRLTSVTRGSSTTLYAYDESDNRISLTLPSGDEWTYGFDLADQITSRSLTPSGGSLSVIETYTHDDDGNMDSRTQGGVTTTYDWNTFNRLRQVKVGGAVSETTSYDHEGIRRLKVAGGGSSKSFSSGAMSLADTRPSGPVSFVQGHQLLGLEQGGNLYFYITDGLSSVRKVVNSSCVSQGEFRFDEFGVPESSTTPSADLSAHSYVGSLGQRNDGASLGLYYARQRYYDASLGRWLSADPIGFQGGLNLYTYVNQNPINGVDPSGLEPYTPNIFITPMEGERQTAELAGQLLNQLQNNSRAGSLNSMIIQGHGNSCFQGFNPRNKNSAGGLVMGKVAGRTRVWLQDEWGNNLGFAEDIFKDKFDLNSRPFITLQGCNVAYGEENLARELSRLVPGVRVVGAPAVANGGGNFGFTRNKPDAKAPGLFSGFNLQLNPFQGDRIYLNGELTP